LIKIILSRISCDYLVPLVAKKRCHFILLLYENDYFYDITRLNFNHLIWACTIQWFLKKILSFKTGPVNLLGFFSWLDFTQIKIVKVLCVYNTDWSIFVSSIHKNCFDTSQKYEVCTFYQLLNCVLQSAIVRRVKCRELRVTNC